MCGVSSRRGHHSFSTSLLTSHQCKQHISLRKTSGLFRKCLRYDKSKAQEQRNSEKKWSSKTKCGWGDLAHKQSPHHCAIALVESHQPPRRQQMCKLRSRWPDDSLHPSKNPKVLSLAIAVPTVIENPDLTVRRSYTLHSIIASIASRPMAAEIRGVWWRAGYK